MRILFLQDKFPPENQGGAGRVAFDLACCMQKLGNQVYVITTVQSKSDVGSMNYNNLEIFKIYANYHERWRNYLSLYNSQTIDQVERIIKQIQPDIVYVHNIHYYLSYYCLKIAKKYSRAVFLTAHDAMLFHYGKLFEFVNPDDLSIPKEFNYRITAWQQIKRFKMRYNPLRNIIIRYYLKYTDKIFAVSYTLKKALNQNGIKSIDVIHNGINVNDWQANNYEIENFKKKHNLFNKKIVFFAGRLSFLKGGGEIIKAMEIVIKQIPGAVLLVAGKEDGYAQKMLKLAKKKDVLIIFTGWLTNNEIKVAYHVSDLCVTPSIYLDPFNLINIEAMACQKPVIGTCFGGTTEIVVDNQTGYIINPLNTQVMAEKIIDLLENPDRTEQFGQVGYKRIKQDFSLVKQTQQYLRWFKKVAYCK